MRIVAYHPALDARGGAELLMVAQMRQLAAAGHDVRLVLLEYAPGKWAEDVAGMPIDHVARDWREAWLHRKSWRRLAARSARVAPRLHDADVVVAYNYPCSALLGYVDVPNVVWHCCEPSRAIHLETANPELASRLEDRFDATPRAIASYRHERNYHRERSRIHHVERLRDREGVAKARKVIAISEYAAGLVRGTYARNPDVVIPPMVKFPRSIHRGSGLHGDGLHVLLHTRLQAHKNADTVIRGFSMYLKRDPRATLDVVGEGPETDFLVGLAAELGAADAVRFHGFLDQAGLENVYRRCDVLACLPMDEPFGMIFPEAAARGLLLIGPDHGGPVEILDGGKLGRLVDALSPDALADAFAETARLDAGEVDRRRAATDRACRHRYSHERVGADLESALLRFAHEFKAGVVRGACAPER